MESRENSIFGRKTFFLNPTLQIERMVIPRLRTLEYEVYVIKSYKDAKTVLREYPDSLCFINIDDQLTFKQWFNFVKSFEVDEKLKGVFLGIFSAKAKAPDKEQFLMKAKLPGGFTDYSDNIELLQVNLQKILDINGAKGRRQFVRLESKLIKSDPSTCFVKDKLVSFSLLDVSAAGFAAIMPADKISLFSKNQFVTNIGLKLNPKTIYVDAEVYAVQVRGNNCIVVFLIPPVVSDKIVGEIRTFVHSTLQKSIDEIINSSIKDLTDYSQEIEMPVQNNAVIPQTIDDLKFEEMGDLEDFDPSMDA